MIARPPARLTAAALGAAALLVLGGAPADAGQGFLLRSPLRVVLGSGELDAVGGVEARLRVTNSHTTVQSFTVWFQGLSDAEGATLWMAAPGTFDAEEVADFAVADNGSGIWAVKANSGWETSPELPLGVESVIALAGARVEVRLPGDDLEDAPVLSGKLGDFDYGDLPARPGSRGNVVRTFRLRLPPDADARPDEAARGAGRIWRKRGRGDLADKDQGIDFLAGGLTEDETYEVWLEDAHGEMVEVGEAASTADGMAFFSVDTRAGDALPVEAEGETVKDLARRRLELRRTGFDEPSLVAILPRIR